MTANSLIPRTCTEIATDDSAGIEGSQPLSAFRDVPAYVLLGEPGSGKTTEFEQECKALADAAELISARSFAKADIAAHPEWRNKVLFIDGLDETRAGARHNTTALDEIQSRLDSLGKPRFRISCRAADWLGPVDRTPLANASPDGRVTTLSLDPLDRPAVHEYLKSELDFEDPTAFISEIVVGGSEFMLDNPLLLRLLIKSATEPNGVPSSRREVFARACRTLAVEHNPSHPRSAMPRCPEAVLAAAERLCAIQLLANKAGYALGSARADVGFIPVAEASSDVDDLPALNEAARTNLFRGAAEQQVAPVHRQVAEYLGASHLAGLISRGDLSARQVCGTLTSPLDGKVVTDLRGLAAWLGTLSPPARSQLIEADPVGMALYGDISEWSVADRRKLLDCLVAQARSEDLWGYTWFDTAEHRYRDAVAMSFRSLCKPDMADTLEECLGAARRSAVPDLIIRLLLRSLAEAETEWLEQLAFLAPQVERLMLDARLVPETRLAAVAAFERVSPPGDTTERALVEVLECLDDWETEDPDGELTGTLLHLLYPRLISPGEVWRYSIEGPGIPISGRYWRFWRYVLLEGRGVDELCQLLDGFERQSDQLLARRGGASLDSIPLDILIRLLNDSDWVAPDALYRWLLAVLNPRGDWNNLRDRKWSEIAERIRGQPDVHKSLIRLWLKDDVGDTHELGHWNLRKLLFPLPDGFVSWCAAEARNSVECDTELAEAFVRLAIRWATPLDETIRQLRSELSNVPKLLEHLEQFLRPSETQLEFQEEELRYQQEIDQIMADHKRERQERQADWQEGLQESRGELAANQFSAPNLHRLALAYFGRLQDVPHDGTPDERVAELIGDNGELLDVVIGALRNAPTRADIPSAERSIELAARSEHDWLAYPVLAGLAIRESEGSLDDLPLCDDPVRSALAIYAAVAPMPDQKPAWPERWLRSDPALVLDVLHGCAIAAIKNGETYLWILDWLDKVDGLDDELRDFRLRLLKSISVRLPLAQLRIVDRLVHQVSKHPDTAALRELVAQKLRAKSMTDAQRVRWTALDAIMNGGEALRLLDDFIGSNGKRARQLAEFFPHEVHSPTLVDRLIGHQRVPTLLALVGIVGRNFPPHELKSGWMGQAEEMSDLVNQWINDLGGQPTEEAGAALNALIVDERLSAWHHSLEFARNQQQRLQRDTSYEPMDVAKVVGLLGDGPPANIADLHVLLRDRLGDLAAHIRGDNSDPWRQFWADDRGAPPTEPKHEDSCRDALLAMLRNRLPEGVDAQPEGQYAADRRADIRVGFKDFNVPIEIKKNTHEDLWTAIAEQLSANYTTDPQTGGYGIYVVLWFGPRIGGYPRHPTTHDRPGTPDELERRLRESLSHEQRRKIGVVVLDVTKPSNHSVRGSSPRRLRSAGALVPNVD